MKSKLAIAVLIAGLAASPFAVSAKTMMHKQTKSSHSSSMGSTTTTGANMKSSTGVNAAGVRGNTSSEGNVGPGTTNNNGAAPGGR